jgi:hypothetical protein
MRSGLKKSLILLGLLLSLGVAVKADQDDDNDNCSASGTNCAYGYHPVCKKVSDPNCDPYVPGSCVKKCRCHCEKDKKEPAQIF